VTLDIIGLAGFGHDYQSVKQDAPQYGHLLVSGLGTPQHSKGGS
jgi:hypothetical protein